MGQTDVFLTFIGYRSKLYVYFTMYSIKIKVDTMYSITVTYYQL